MFMWSVLVVYGDWLAFGTKLKSIRGAAGLCSSLLAVFQPQWLLIGYWLFTKYCGLYQLLPNLYILPQVSRHLLIPPICTVESSKMSTLLWSFHSSSCRHFFSFKVNMKDSDIMLQMLDEFFGQLGRKTCLCSGFVYWNGAKWHKVESTDGNIITPLHWNSWKCCQYCYSQCYTLNCCYACTTCTNNGFYSSLTYTGAKGATLIESAADDCWQSLSHTHPDNRASGPQAYWTYAISSGSVCVCV